MKLSEEDKFWSCSLGFILLVCMLAIGAFVVGVEYEDQIRLRERRQKTYPAWCAAHPELNLDFEQWNELYRKNLLPR